MIREPASNKKRESAVSRGEHGKRMRMKVGEVGVFVIIDEIKRPRRDAVAVVVVEDQEGELAARIPPRSFVCVHVYWLYGVEKEEQSVDSSACDEYA